MVVSGTETAGVGTTEKTRTGMRIALDAHGGDFGLERNVAVALQFIEDPAVRLVLVGHEEQIRAEVARQKGDFQRLHTVHAETQIGMDESAAQSVRRKGDNSISVALQLQRAGSVDAVVSAGHSGAVVAASLLTLGRTPGVHRPALGTRIPAIPTTAFILDIGAVIDPRPEWMVQFAYLGAAYVRGAYGISKPTVALLSNGEERSKGNQLVRETRDLLEATGLNFIGYVEAREMMSTPPHVTVTDGFTGNVAIKLGEGTAIGIQRVMREELTASWHTKILAAMLKPALRRVGKRLDFEGVGGVPLLGVDGVVVISHGRSTVAALSNAVRNAAHSVEIDLVRIMRDAIPRPQSAANGRVVDAAVASEPRMAGSGSGNTASGGDAV